MSREIKFRAWDKLQKRFGYLDLSSSDFGDPTWFDCELMQYTGMKDKNDVEIYEGDIVQLDRMPSDKTKTPLICQIEYMPEAMGFYATQADNFVPFSGQNIRDKDRGAGWRDWLRANNYKNHAVEVIGNIYENPELLESDS